jgi:AcrR family transcriptional regulator
MSPREPAATPAAAPPVEPSVGPATGSARGRRLRRDQQHAQTRARLLDAAGQVFARKGFHAASLEEVAEQAGFSKGAVYSNFASKQELFAALLAERCHGSLLAISGAAGQGGSTAERLDRVGHAVLARILDQPEVTLLFLELWVNAARSPDLRARFAEVFGQTRAAVAGLIDARAQRLGAELPAPAELLASLAMAVVDGLALQLVVDPERVPPDAAGTALRLLLASLLTADPDTDPATDAAAPATATQGG